MTLKYIKETLQNKGYHFFDGRKIDFIGEILIYKINNPDDLSDREYFASFSVEKSKILFNGNLYKTVDDFIKAAEEYNSTLEYPINCYDKMYNKNYRVMMKVYHYVENILKFKRDNSTYDRGIWYVKEYGIVNKIRFRVIDNLDTDKEAGSVYVQLPNGWCIDQNFKTEDDAISIINGFIESETLNILSNAIETLGALDGKVNFNLDAYRFNYGALSVDKTNLKDIIRERLKNALEKIG